MSLSATRRFVYRTLLGAAIFSFAVTTILADDGAASIAAGGLVFTRETRIVMAKEVLTISEKKIVVDYEFRNDTDENVTTEVAFPVPPYENDWLHRYPKEMAFADFALTVDGKATQFQVEAKAFLKGRDLTPVLVRDKVDIATFGHFLESAIGNSLTNSVPDIQRLPRAEQKKLESEGLYVADPDLPEARWTVIMQYHWTQTFPAHSTVRIRHEYRPVLGFSQVDPQQVANRLVGKPESSGTDTAAKTLMRTEGLASYCADRSTLLAIQAGFNRAQ